MRKTNRHTRQSLTITESTNLLRINSKIAQIRVEPVKNRLDGAVILKENKDECQSVEDADAKDEPPESRMRACKGAIGKGEQTDDEEEEEDALGRRPEIILKVGVIAREGGVEDGRKGSNEEGEAVRLVEELQRYVVHGALVYRVKVVVYVPCGHQRCWFGWWRRWWRSTSHGFFRFRFGFGTHSGR